MELLESVFMVSYDKQASHGTKSATHVKLELPQILHDKA